MKSIFIKKVRFSIRTTSFARQVTRSLKSTMSMLGTVKRLAIFSNSFGILLTIICLGLLPRLSTAQNTSPTNNTNNVVIPPPPNVASFLKVADIPVSTYNGTGQVTIPLYTLEAGDLKIPISISYYNNGLKVTEEASWVGFGWNLNAGGVIHQNIVGNPDPLIADGSRGISGSPLPIDMAAINNTDLREPNRLEHGCTFLNDNYAQTVFASSQLVDNGAQVTGGNNEYDQFIYNFGGYSGKFIYPNYPTATPVLLDRNNIQFKFDGSYFTATTPDGTQYLFTTTGHTVTNPSICSVNTTQTTTSTSWYLAKVISPDGNIATLVYQKYVSSPLPILSESYSENQIGGNGTYLQTQGFIRDINYSQVPSSFSLSDNSCYSTSQEDNLILSSITTANATIVFNTSARTDVDQGLKLDNISIYRTGETTPFKGFAFSYNYFTGSSIYGDWTTDPNIILGSNGVSAGAISTPSVQLRSQRLKLNSVQTLGASGTSEPPYQFVYNNSSMPYKTSMAQDLWGYFNGYNNHSLLPDYNNLGYFDSNVPLNLINSDMSSKKMLAMRATVPQYLQAGILNEIINPTGGYTKIYYEPNQYNDMPGLHNQIRDTTLYVTDHAAGSQQIVFTVPDIGYQAVIDNPNPTLTSVNPATITVTLANANNVNCGAGILGYNSGQNNANGLYAVLQMWDPVHSVWNLPTQNNIFDFTSTQWQNPPCSGQIVYSSAIPESLVPGQYRIVVNFPDNETGGLPEPSASASIHYKYISTQAYPNYGGGLRIKSEAEYTDASHVSNQKIYSYYSGRLITKPIFYRNFVDFDDELRALLASNEPSNSLGSVSMSCGSGNAFTFPNQAMDQSPLELAVASLSLYSNPLINYSYSASGAAVGYDSVKVDYSIGQDIGQSVYKYTNVHDSVYYYPGMPPGIPGASYILNGSLITQKELKKTNNGTLSLIKEEDNNYVVNNFQDYWAYKTEYVQPYSSCVGSANTGLPVEGQGIGLFWNYLHFYPVKAGKVLLINKTETYYDSSYPYSVYTAYQYNGQNQLNYTLVTKSDGRSDIQQTYYPGDYTVSSGFLYAMQQKNMIDYPIEVINSTSSSNNTSSTLTASATFKQYYSHDNNIISPQNIYTLNSVTPVAITPSIPGGNMDSHYELRETYAYDQYGNQMSAQKIGGQVTNYLWDYSHLYPVAKVDNTSVNDFAYTSFEADATGNWQYSGTATADNTSPTGKYCYNLSNGSITNSSLTAAKTYIVSYWTKNSAAYAIAGTAAGFPIQVRALNGWYNFQHKVTGVTGVTLSGLGFIDELRLYPADAEMETFTYEPLIGTSAVTDTKGNSTYYFYDALQHLFQVKNLDGDITKMYAYKYAGYAPGMAPFSNIAMSQSFSKNNCSAGYAGSSVVYTVPANTYTSYVSLAAANDLAQSDINDNGQANANATGSCAIAPCSAGTITNVAVSGTAYTMTYTQSVGSSVIVRIYDPSGNQIAPPGGSLSLSGGTISGTVPAAGKSYTFDLWVYSSTCPNGVMATPVTVSF